MSTNLSATTPAAPGGNTNVTWQSDGHGNISGYVPTGGGTTLTGTGIARNTGACTELSGDATTSGSNAVTLKNTGTAGTYTKVTTDAQGRVSSGTTLSGSDLPNPSSSTLGGIQSIAAVTHKYLTSISTLGVPASAQPVLADLSDTPAQNLVVASPVGSSGALTARALDPTDMPIVSATGSPALQLPTGIIPSAAETLTAFGASNTQQCIQFVMGETMTFGHVTVYIGTGVVSDLMGIAIYDAAGTTELAKADAFSVDTTHTLAQRVALAAPVTLYAGKTYWIAWTCSASGTVTTLNYLISANWQSVYCASVVRVGTSGTATSGGKCNTTIGTVSNVQIRLPVMIFD